LRVSTLTPATSSNEETVRIETRKQFKSPATCKNLWWLTLLSITLLSALATAQPHPVSPSLSRASSQTDWVQFHFDPALDGFNPYETILGPSNVGNVTLKWSYAPSEGYGVTGEPAVVNGVMYFGIAYTGVSEKHTGPSGTGFALYALNADTGAFLWKYQTEPIFGSPAVANGVVYASDPGTLYAVDANTGALIWQFAVSTGQYCSPTVANNVVYIAAGDPLSKNNIHAVNAQTGKQIWAYQTTGTPFNTVAVANGVLYSNSSDGSVYALDATTGSLIWKKQFGSSITPKATLNQPPNGAAVANGVLYLPVRRTFTISDIYALDAATGDLIWRTSVGGLYQMTPAIDNGLVYIVPDKIYALNASTGAIVWQNASGGQSPPNVANGVVYTAYLEPGAQGASRGVLVALDAGTGALLWQHTTEPGGWSSAEFPTPIVVNGTIYGSLILSGEDQVGAWSLPN
jgi:outer membrane protein assembly factor BamB